MPAIAFKITAVALSILGVGAIVWGVTRLDERPIPMRPSGSHAYSTSRQLAAISSGASFLLLAWAAYKEGRARDDPPG